MEIIGLVLLLSFNFLLSLYLINLFIGFAHSIGLKGTDINKPFKKEIPESFGIPIYFSLTASLTLYAIISALMNLSINESLFLYYLLGLGLMVMVGFLEDLTILRKEKYKKTGFSQKYKILLPLIPAIPLIYATLNKSIITLPFIGVVDVGLLYPLVLVPIGIIGASNATNMLAGLNGLETLLGIITITTLGIYAFFVDKYLVVVISLFFVSSLLAFYIYNKYPAKAFPGDSLTYSIGYTIATLSILGDMEKFALSIFILWFVELLLKARSMFKAESFGKLNDKGALIKPYDKIYSLTHIFMNGKRSEKEIVYTIATIQLAICIIALIYYLV